MTDDKHGELAERIEAAIRSERNTGIPPRKIFAGLPEDWALVLEALRSFRPSTGRTVTCVSDEQLVQTYADGSAAHFRVCPGGCSGGAHIAGLRAIVQAVDDGIAAERTVPSATAPCGLCGADIAVRRATVDGGAKRTDGDKQP